MKKSRNLVLGMLILTLLLSIKLHAQEDPKPVFVTVTTLHRNLDTDRKDWKQTEQEYFDKVTSKNDLIIGSELLNHYYTGFSIQNMGRYRKSQ